MFTHGQIIVFGEKLIMLRRDNGACFEIALSNTIDGILYATILFESSLLVRVHLKLIYLLLTGKWYMFLHRFEVFKFVIIFDIQDIINFI